MAIVVEGLESTPSKSFVDCGSIMNFWIDSWIADLGPFLNYYRTPSLVDNSITLDEMVSMDRDWNWGYLRFF